MSTQVILLERVEKLGAMGDVVAVKPGYARNFLLPQKKALRASKENIAYFEAQKKVIAAESDKQKAVAEKSAKKIEGTKVSLIRQASEAGQLFGSVASRDIASALTEACGETIDRSQIKLNDNFKQIGLFPVAVSLHPEVKVEITLNIARSVEEAKIQADTGRALIAGANEQEAPAEVDAEEALKDVLEDDALEAEKERQAEADEKAAEDAVKAEEKAAKKAEKAAAQAAADEAEAADAEGEEAAAE